MLSKFPPDEVAVMSDLLKARRMCKDYGCKDYFAYRELPPEWVSFCLQADGMEAAIADESTPT